MDLISMFGLVLGGGTLGVVAAKLVDARKLGLQHARETRAALVADAQATASDLRNMLQEERQNLQKERDKFQTAMDKALEDRKGHMDCLGRVAAVEGELREVRKEYAAVREEHRGCPEKIRKLEDNVLELTRTLVTEYSMDRITPPDAMPTVKHGRPTPAGSLPKPRPR